MDARLVELYGVAREGMFTAAQARALGYSRHALRWGIESGRWTRVHRGLFKLGHGRPSWLQRAHGALLLAGPTAALSHRAAAHLLRLEGFATHPPRVIDVTVSHQRRAGGTLAGVRVHRTKQSHSVLQVQGVRVTGVVRTLMDLSPEVDLAQLEFALDSARGAFPSLPAWLGRELGVARHGVKGAAVLRTVMVRRGSGGVESPLEAGVRQALHRAGLPPPTLQHQVVHRGVPVMRLDFAWPELRVGLHVDGYAWHAQRERFMRDARQRSRLAAIGWSAAIVTADSLEDGSWLHDLRALLAAARPRRGRQP